MSLLGCLALLQYAIIAYVELLVDSPSNVNPLVKSLSYPSRSPLRASFSGPRNKARNLYATGLQGRFRKNKIHTTRSTSTTSSNKGSKRMTIMIARSTIMRSSTITRRSDNMPIIRLKPPPRMITVSYLLNRHVTWRHHFIFAVRATDNSIRVLSRRDFRAGKFERVTIWT